MQGDMTLRSDTLDFFRDQQKLLAIGAVEVVQGTLELEGEQVEYRMDTERALARGAPRVVQNPPGGGRQVMRAREILASNKGGWVRGDLDRDRLSAQGAVGASFRIEERKLERWDRVFNFQRD